MRGIVLIFLIAFSVSVALSQTYAEKNHYLVDSLDLEELTDSDIQLLDSALNVYHNAKHDTDRLNALLLIQQNMMHDDWGKYNLFAKELTEKKLLDNPAQPLKNIYLGFLADAINNIGFIYDNQGNVSKALEYYHKSMEICKTMEDTNGMAGSLINIGAIYYDQGAMSKSLKYFFESLKMTNDDKGVAVVLNNIALIYKGQKDYDNSLKYYKKSLKLKEKIGNMQSVSTTLSNIGELCSAQGDMIKALEYYNKSLDIKEEIGDKKGAGLTLSSIGNVYSKRQDYDNALLYYEKALEVLEEIGYKKGVALTMVEKGFIHLYIGDVKFAEKYAEDSFKIGNKLGSPQIIRGAAKLWSKLHKRNGEYKKGLEMYELYITMRDSIQNEETEKATIQQEAKYQIEKKEQEIILQGKNIELLKKDKKIKGYVLYGLLIFIGLLTLTIYLWFRNYKQKRKVEEIEVRHQLEMYIKEIDILRTHSDTQMANKDQQGNVQDLNSFLSNPLSGRELEVLEELSKGKTNKEIAETLFVSVNTIRTHLNKIYEKLDVTNRTQAVKKANDIENPRNS